MSHQVSKNHIKICKYLILVVYLNQHFMAFDKIYTRVLLE